MNPFVRKPYINCPKCNENYFGVIGAGEFSYQRRCAKCGYPPPKEWTVAAFPLPQLSKKIIYLDQFLISNMVKSLHPDFDKQIEPFYRQVFEKLDRLSKLQAIICPDSQFHEQESSFARDSKEHKRVYELLSHGVTYKDFWTILRYEVSEQLENWLSGKPMGETAYDAQRFCHGKIHHWQETILVTIDNSKRLETEREGRKEGKKEIHQILQGNIPIWQANKNSSFDFWYKRELDQWPKNFLNAAQEYALRMSEILSGKRTMEVSDLSVPPLYSIFRDIDSMLSKEFLDEGTKILKLNEFWSQLKFVPFIRIFAMLFAALGTKISSGMSPDKMTEGTFNDILMISGFLPFCEAIFLDNQMAGFLRDNPLKNSLKKMPKVFSIATKGEFLKYLDDIEKSLPKEHFEKIEEVYGVNWHEPYVAVLKDFKKE